MSKYNEAELHAIKELDPQGYLNWQLPELDPDLAWYTWLESQVAPPPGMPFLRCDCVAGLRSQSGSQPPWACLIEAQAQFIPRMAVWVMVYLGLLHEDLRFGPHDRDRFQMMAAVLNLTDTTLSTAIDWVPPIKPAAPQAEQQAAPQPEQQATPQAEQQAVPQPEQQSAPQQEQQATPQPEQQSFGVKCKFWVRNAREEKADLTLELIADGKIALCILVWVPVMAGGDDPRVLKRWQEVALLQTEPHMLADYVVLALVFAELVGRKPAWAAVLKEFNVNDSTFLQEIEDKAIKKGLVKGALVGKIQAFQEMLKQPVTPETELRARPEQELDSLLTQLRKQLLANGQ
jgi:hypothetical protein